MFEILRITLTYLLVSFFAHVEAALPFMSETVSWNENVVLRDGSKVLVSRAVTYGADQFGRSGRGRLKTQSMSFTIAGKRYSWTNDDVWPIVYMPEMLDVYNGVPVIVMPVHRFGPCQKYDFPQAGMIGLTFRNSEWQRISIDLIPADFKMNLLRSTHAVQFWDDYKNRTIEHADLIKLAGNSGGPQVNDPIGKAIKYFSGLEDSCSRIRPPPDPKLEVAKKRSIEIDIDAKSVVASVFAINLNPEVITREGYARAKNIGRVLFKVADVCQEVLKAVEPLREYGANGGWQLTGYQLVFGDGKKVPIQEPNLRPFQAPAQLEIVTCDAGTIYVIRRSSRTPLLIHRVNMSGDLLDAVRVDLPEAQKVLAGNSWGDVWEASVKDGLLKVALANYTYTGTADGGGTVTQKQSYTAKLP